MLAGIFEICIFRHDNFATLRNMIAKLERNCVTMKYESNDICESLWRDPLNAIGRSISHEHSEACIDTIHWKHDDDTNNMISERVPCRCDEVGGKRPG